MSKLTYLFISVFITFSCTAQERSKNDNFSEYGFRYEGIDNNPELDPDFNKGGEAIKRSILENLNHLNLFEYAHVLPELYELINNGELKISDWKNFTDSLEQEVVKYMNDTIPAYWAVDHLGIIPLQADFFLASLHKSEKLKNKYPKVFKLLSDNTSRMKGMGYGKENYDSLVKISDTKGESTFWYFFQLEDCKLIDLVSNKMPKDNLIHMTFETLVISTYKTPIYLQKRKWQGLCRRLNKSNNKFCQQIGSNMANTVIYALNDKDREYFNKALKEGVNRNKSKEF